MVIYFINSKGLLEKKRLNFSDQLKKTTKRYKIVGYNMDIMLQSAYLIANPITACRCGILFNCMAVDQASDLMTALT